MPEPIHRARMLGYTDLGPVQVAVSCAALVRVADPQEIEATPEDAVVSLAELLGAEATGGNARVLVLENDGRRLLVHTPDRVKIVEVDAVNFRPIPQFLEGLYSRGVGELYMRGEQIGYVLSFAALVSQSVGGEQSESG